MATGLEPAGAFIGASLAHEPGAELPLDGADVATGEIALRSKIIFCKLVKASPPCFCVAASTAACIASRGADTGAVMDRVPGADWESFSPGLEGESEDGEGDWAI